MQHTSISLLDSLQDQEDQVAWQRMFEVYTPLIRKWLVRFHAPSTDVDDLAQNVMTVVIRKLPEFSHAGRTGAFRAWLRTITRNCLLEFWRKNKLTPTATGKTSFQDNLNQLSNDQSELSQQWNREYDQHVVASLLKTIQPEFRPKTWESFRLFVMEDKPAKEVAEILGVSVNTVFIAKSRVMSRLRTVGKNLIDEC
ncbi:MAG: sigma-70 family RNA polymerase sigma factor [Planctomycetota bacterium]